MSSSPSLRLFAAALAAVAVVSCAEANLAVHGAKRFGKKITAPAPAPTGPAAVRPAPATETYKIGDPYEVAGVWYYPKLEPEYDENGIASWYGKPFHGRRTANGEVFDMNELTAAHRTLPLPSMVRVTNLENGRSLVLRVNDRGPFIHGRIIDVSRRAAQLLGFERDGTARVRVRVVDGIGSTIIPKPVTPEVERTAVAAAPQDSVAAEPLAPPPGLKAAAPRPKAALPTAATTTLSLPPDPPTADGAVTVYPVRATRLYVQAGAFSFFDNARELRRRLLRFGRAEVSHVTVNGQTFYRVRVGPIDNLELADLTLDRLIAAGYPGARIVVE